MCGIFGCVGTSRTLPILINGLELLEYRGYDSAGVAFFENKKINIVKEVGKVKNLKDKLNLDILSTCGIAHTRWATHGKPTDINCHPHTSGKICLVHNGIIENFSELKKELNNNFYSDTDSELIAKLINNNYQKNIKKYLEKNNKKTISKNNKIKILLNSISQTAHIMRGSWACAVICEDILDNIFVFKKSSPLLVGKSNKFNLISSDISAINTIFNENKINKNINLFNLNDNEFAIINKNDVQFFDINLNTIIKQNIEIDSESLNTTKQNFDHFMLKEIYEIPASVEKTFNSILESKNEELINALINCSKVTIIGCGTAYHAGLAGKFYLSNILNKKVEVQLASEFRYSKQVFDNNEIVFGISQSGETADTIAGLKLAKENNLKTIVLTNVKNSSITDVADFKLYTEAGTEIGVAATKSFNSQVAAMLALATKVKTQIDNNDEFAKNLLNKFKCVSNLLSQEVSKDDEVNNYKKYFNKQKFFFIGRDIDSMLSYEGALKLKEIAYVHAEGYAAGELKHGTLSLLDENSLLIGIITQKKILEKTLNAVHEAKARGASVLLISQFDISSQAEDFIQLLGDDELISPILAVIPLQLFAYYMSLNKGYDPDKPRNLAKSVTVEWFLNIKWFFQDNNSMKSSNIQKLMQLIGANPDIIQKNIKCCDKNITLIFFKSMIDGNLFVSGILKPLTEYSTKLESQKSIVLSLDNIQKELLLTSDIEKLKDLIEMKNAVLRNKVLLFVDGDKNALAIDIESYPVRLPSEPPTSAVIKGPREGFVEDIKTNITLLKRRFASENFTYEEMKVGKYSQTRVAVVYIKGITNKSIIRSIKNRISKIDIDGIIDSYYILKLLEEKKHSIFRQVGSSEKPDIVSAKLLEGRVAVVVDNSPIVLTLPYMYVEDLQSSNDYYSSYQYSTFIRLIRMLGIFIAIIVPGFYLSLRFYHYNLMPFKFLVTIGNSTQNVPMTPFLEIIFILALFQLLYEVSLRLPRYLGLATSIVGALILGDTGVKAGLISPPGVLIIALSMICIYTVPDQSDQLNLVRGVFIVLGGGMGIFGIIAGFIFIIGYLNSFYNYGSPYLAPFSPFIKNDLQDAIYKATIVDMQKRPESLHNKNKVRLKKWNRKLQVVNLQLWLQCLF